MRKHLENIERIEKDISCGLSYEEVEKRKQNGLTNKTNNKSSVSYAGIVFSELFTYFNIVYMVITAVLLIVGQANQLTYLFVIIPNLIIGIWQKCRSKYNLDKLSLMVSSKATVVRGGKEEKIDINDIVRDDIIKFESGNQISADCLLCVGECEVNESLLTGESLPVKKGAGDRLYAGSYITSGSCIARAYDVGAENYVSKLASKAKRYSKPKSEILRTLNGVIKVIGIALIPLAVLLYLRIENVVKVAGAVIGMIPSGMFLLTSTALAVSMLRLSKHNTLVQEMYCIEMLARVDTICMDKTGTITDGTMTVQNAINFTKEQVADIVPEMLSCNKDANFTTKALISYFGTKSTQKVVEYLAFSSDRKYFAVKFEKSAYALGAPEFVFNVDANNEIKQQVEEEAKKGHRCIALVKIGEKEALNSFNINSTTIVGLIVLEDHIREDATKTISYFKQNGVNLKVISGDNPLTVSEVALRAGVEGAEKYISLQNMELDEVAKIANNYVVFGRVSPQQKKVLVNAIKEQEHTVAMIGDGVNDILALKEADCSVSVGSGSEAAKNVSHLILVDDNFSNMQQVIAEGRRCTNNLQSTGSMFLTKTFICIVFCLFGIITAFEYPFSPNQLLFLELFAIGLPGVFFALQPNTNIIKGKFLDNVLSKAFAQGLTGLLLSMPLYFLCLSASFTQEVVQMMITIIVTVNSLAVLFRVTRPLNKFRLSVALSMVVCSILGYIFLTDLVGLNILTGALDVFDFQKMELNPLLIVLAECVVIYPLQMLISFITNKTIAKLNKK